MKKLLSIIFLTAFIAVSVPTIANVEKQKNTFTKAKPCPNYLYTYTVDGPVITWESGNWYFYRYTYGVGILGEVTLISSVRINYIPPAPPTVD